MADKLGRIGDFIDGLDMNCEVPGCGNLRNPDLASSVDAIRQEDDALPQHVCEECLTLYREFKPEEIECTGKECSNTWTWTPYQQLAAKRKGFSTPPARLCEECAAKASETPAVEIECKIKDCQNTWRWTAEQQLAWQKDEQPRRLCDSCHRRLKQLRVKNVECKVRGCSETWRWKPFRQLEHEKAGGSLDEPPKRMCENCRQIFNELQDKYLPCKVEECDQTWRFSRYAQLEQLRRYGPEGPLPQRMCQRCSEFINNAHTLWLRCKVPGCRNKWKYSRARQLQDHLQGKTHSPEAMCRECVNELSQLTPKQLQCNIPGCDKTWTYSSLDQLKDKRRHRHKPPERRCEQCDLFLGGHHSIQLVCSSCQRTFQWTAYQQLLYEKGKFTKPDKCVDCRHKEMAEAVHPGRTDEPLTTDTDQRYVIRMPHQGKWRSDPQIREWPPRLDHHIIEQAETADIRIVAFGDDLTYSVETPAKTWPNLLQHKLTSLLADQGIESVCTVNAGIPKTTSAQGLARLYRDVRPFAPHLVIFSFAFADSFLEPLESNGDWRELIKQEEANQAIEELCRELQKNADSLIYWTPNPIFPEHRARENRNYITLGNQWIEAQKACEQQIVRHAVHACEKNNIPVLDVESRFEVNGRKSAAKWMADWYRHNEAGAENIANWMADFIIRKDLLALN